MLSDRLGWTGRDDRGFVVQLLRGLMVCLVLVIMAALLAVITVEKYASLPAANTDERRLVDDESPVVLFLGDSYTAGVGADPGEGWAQLVGNELGWVVVNGASGGTGFVSSVSGPAAQLACARPYCPSFGEAARRAAGSETFDLIIMSGGRSDEARPLAEELLAIDAVLQVLKSEFPGTPVITTNPLWDSTIPPASLGEMAKRLKSESGVTYLELGQPLQFRPELISSDGIHPNNKGHRVIAEKFVVTYQAAA